MRQLTQRQRRNARIRLNRYLQIIEAVYGRKFIFNGLKFETTRIKPNLAGFYSMRDRTIYLNSAFHRVIMHELSHLIDHHFREDIRHDKRFRSIFQFLVELDLCYTLQSYKRLHSKTEREMIQYAQHCMRSE